MENWLEQQITAVTENWGTTIQRFYPDAYQYWSTADRNLELMKEVYFKPLMALKWEKLLNRPQMKALDLGCGSGWLTAWLSKQENVEQIDALDSDKKNLENLLPRMVELLEGEPSKIKPVLGLFEPIQRPDEHYDLIVASSSIHHSSNLFSILRELARTLVPSGKLIIMNEVPRSQDEYLNYVMTMVYHILNKSLLQKSSEFQDSLSANGILYDPRLGDYAFSYYHYHQAIIEAGLDYEIIHTGCAGGASELVHFVCSHDPSAQNGIEQEPNRLELKVDPAKARHVERITLSRVEQVIGVTGEGSTSTSRSRD